MSKATFLVGVCCVSYINKEKSSVVEIQNNRQKFWKTCQAIIMTQYVINNSITNQHISRKSRPTYYFLSTNYSLQKAFLIKAILLKTVIQFLFLNLF